jgi:beta-galactosidase
MLNRQIEKQTARVPRSSPSRALWDRFVLPAMVVLSALVWLGCDLTTVEQAGEKRASLGNFPYGDIWATADAGPDGAGPYGANASVPAPSTVAGTQRRDIIINPKWKFLRGDDARVAPDGTPSAATVDFDESTEHNADGLSWIDLDLPHTWNWTDGQNGPALSAGDQNYYRGRAWYRKRFDIPSDMVGKKLFLQFDASSYITDCWVNGIKVGTHKGGYAAFRFDITHAVSLGQPGKKTIIAVKVDNSANFVASSSTIKQDETTASVSPLYGDFTMFGGIYRDLHLIALPELSLSPFHYASSGVYLRPVKNATGKADTKWAVKALVKLVNSAPVEKTATVDLVLYDPNDKYVATFTGSTKVPPPVAPGATAPAGQVPGNGTAPSEYGSADLQIGGTVDNPMLWDGLGKGNVYHAYVVVRDGAQQTDGGSPQTDAGADADTASADAGTDVSVGADAADDAATAVDAVSAEAGPPVDIAAGAADAVVQPLGFRTFSFDYEKGWFLNYDDNGERSYPLRGVCMHQDHQNRGGTFSNVVEPAWRAIDDDFKTLKELSPTFIRFAHYQHSQYTYDQADKLGFVAWAENAWVDAANGTDEFRENVSLQMEELVYQSFNHPSILMWSCGNEVLFRTLQEDQNYFSPFRTMVECVRRAKIAENLGVPWPGQNRPPENRPIVYAQNGWRQALPAVWQAELVAFNEYQGWYSGYPYEFADWANELHKCAKDVAGSANVRKSNGEMCWIPQPNQDLPRPQTNFPIGVSEYGAGANPLNHDLPVRLYQGDRTSGYQTEEYQAYFHESFYWDIYEHPFLVLTSVWNMFDFASDNRDEGNLPGLNTKGLVAFDHKTKKDSFYFYQANWANPADTPIVHIASKRYTVLPQRSSTVRVYSNLHTVSLWVNGKEVGRLTLPEPDQTDPWLKQPSHPRNRIFRFRNVAWASGFNVVKAIAYDAAGNQVAVDPDPAKDEPELRWAN